MATMALINIFILLTTFWIFILETQDEKSDGNESCVKFYCPSDLIKPENEWLLCAKTGGNNSSLIKRDLQSLPSHSYENSTEMLIKILKKYEYNQWKACFKYNDTKEMKNSNCNFNHLKKCNCNCSNTESYTKEFFQSGKYVFLLFGLIALIGNLVVIFFVSKKLLFVATVKENAVYNILVLNLSFADLLLAIHVILVSFIIRNHVICNALGVISVTGYQVGTTIIVLICYYRLHGVLKPFKVIRKKVLLIILIFVWIMWLMFSLLPIIWPDVFLPTRGEKFDLISKSVESTLSNAANNTDVFSELLNTVSKFNFSQVREQLLKSLDIYPNKKFYDQQRVCTISFLRFKSNGKHLLLAMLLYNSFSLIFIVIAYIIIFIRVFNCRNLITSFFLQLPDNGRKAKENSKVFIKIFFIVATNFFCWTPVCIIGFLFYFKSLNKNECLYCKFLNYHHIVQKVMLLLILINPSLNPYIYCNKFWKRLFKSCKTRIFCTNNRLRQLKCHTS